MGKATQDLRKEHDAVLFVLQILDQMILADDRSRDVMLAYYGEVVYFLSTFVDKCHHGKEENMLFPALVAKGVASEGGPVGAMLGEHARGRQYIARMRESLDAKDAAGFAGAARQYSDLLVHHIDKENGVLFVVADKVVPENEQDSLYEEFERFEESVIGHGVHERLHAMIDRWAQDFAVE
ncbi:MAG: hemerythrin [Clostridiales bacterium]|nr:hemerythrin [Clostridiales bacterium]